MSKVPVSFSGEFIAAVVWWERSRGTSSRNAYLLAQRLAKQYPGLLPGWIDMDSGIPVIDWDIFDMAEYLFPEAKK